MIPTRARPHYLEVALASLGPQAAAEGAELLVISDGPDPATAAVAERQCARLVSLHAPAGLNAARNEAVAAASAELIVFVDDDVEVPPGWLAAFLKAADEAHDYDVFGGPIWPKLEGGGPRACGREPAPITTLELGTGDLDVELVWGANMAVRRRAFALAGLFDETILGRGDEEEWERRYRATGGRIRYVAGAGLHHRRTVADSTVSRLARAAYGYGRSARRYDGRQGEAPSLRSELRTLAGCVWHVLRRRCAIGIVLVAQTAGRLREALTARLDEIASRVRGTLSRWR